MKRTGFTLLEVMISIVVLSLVLGMLFTLALSMGQAARAQEAKVTTGDDARTGMFQLVRELRQAASSSIAWATLPGAQITYRIAQDTDGNGTAVDVTTRLELGLVRTVRRDTADLNGDGVGATQLIITDGANVQVLANGLLPDEDANGNGALDAGEDTNGNARLDRGLWFQPQGRGIRITIQGERLADPRGLRMTSTLSEVVVPRN